MTSFDQLFGTLVEEDRLYRTLRQVHRHMEYVIEFDDFSQEVLLRSWSKRHTFRGQTAEELLAWVRQVARSVLVDWIRHEAARKRRFTQHLDSALESQPAISLTEDFVVKTELRSALSILSSEERSVLIHHYFWGYNFREIAEIMDKSYHAVIRLHAKALGKMRAEF